MSQPILSIIAGSLGASLPSANVTLPAVTQSASQSVTQPTNAYAGWRFNRDGTVDRMQSTALSGWTYNHDWCDNPSTSIGDQFTITRNITSGTLTGDQISTGVDLSADRYVYTSVTINMSNITNECTLDVTIKETATTSNQDTCTYFCGAYT